MDKMYSATIKIIRPGYYGKLFQIGMRERGNILIIQKEDGSWKLIIPGSSLSKYAKEESSYDLFFIHNGVINNTYSNKCVIDSGTKEYFRIKSISIYNKSTKSNCRYSSFKRKLKKFKEDKLIAERFYHIPLSGRMITVNKKEYDKLLDRYNKLLEFTKHIALDNPGYDKEGYVDESSEALSFQIFKNEAVDLLNEEYNYNIKQYMDQ